MFAAFNGEIPEDSEHGDSTEGPEACMEESDCVYARMERKVVLTPFVATLDESADKASNNHDFVKEDGPQDGWPWQTGSEKEVHKKQRRGHEP